MDTEDQRIAILTSLGWTDLREQWTSGDERARKALMGTPPDGGGPNRQAPWYPHNIDTAFPLIQTLIREGWHCTVQPGANTAKCTFAKEGVTCGCFSRETVEHEARQQLSWPASYMVSEAICGAYLRARGLYTE